MNLKKYRLLLSLVLLSCPGFLLALFAGPGRADPPSPVRIGIPKTLFREVPESMIQVAMLPFNTLVKGQTGMDGTLIMGTDGMELARKLDGKEVDLAVLHGYEFAWAQQKYPNLRGLVIAVNQHRELTANLVTRNDSAIASFADSKGKEVSLPKQSRGHCHLYLERACEGCGTQPKSYFAKIISHSDVLTAMDEVVRGNVECLVVDGVALECYQHLKPGCFNRLKVVEQSPVFPAAVICYRDGGLDDAALTRFKKGMISAKDNPQASYLMTMWKLTAFEPIPANYTDICTNIRKVYPSPDSALQAATQTMGQ